MVRFCWVPFWCLSPAHSPGGPGGGPAAPVRRVWSTAARPKTSTLQKENLIGAALKLLLSTAVRRYSASIFLSLSSDVSREEKTAQSGR